MRRNHDRDGLASSGSLLAERSLGLAITASIKWGTAVVFALLSFSASAGADLWTTNDTPVGTACDSQTVGGLSACARALWPAAPEPCAATWAETSAGPVQTYGNGTYFYWVYGHRVYTSSGSGVCDSRGSLFVNTPACLEPLQFDETTGACAVTAAPPADDPPNNCQDGAKSHLSSSAVRNATSHSLSSYHDHIAATARRSPRTRTAVRASDGSAGANFESKDSSGLWSKKNHAHAPLWSSSFKCESCSSRLVSHQPVRSLLVQSLSHSLW